MHRILTAVAVVLGLALAPVTASAAPADRPAGLAVPGQVTADRDHQEVLALQAELVAVTQQRDSLQGQVTSLQGQVTALQGQLAAVSVGAGAGPAGNVVSPPPAGGPNRFAFGYCTWYVATRRYVPWLGNAIDWWVNARAFGFPEGYTPRPGAIEVSRASALGHVAYVEQVNADGTFLVSEMNYVAWDVVDRRLVVPPREPIVGFIY